MFPIIRGSTNFRITGSGLPLVISFSIINPLFFKKIIQKNYILIAFFRSESILSHSRKDVTLLFYKKEEKNDTTKHAEIIAIQKASKKLNAWRLTGCEMYVTLEPCSMCAGALIQSRISKVYIGTMDYKTGACGSVLNLLKDYEFNHKVEMEKDILQEDYKFNHKVEVETNIMQKECEKILKDFFKYLRSKK